MNRVYSFEIQPKIINIALRNVSLNNKNNITIYNKCLSNRTGDLVGFTYIDYGGENISSVGIKTERGMNGQCHCGSIETVRLDDTGIKNIGLIKLDVEGHEPDALEGMWDSIDKWKPYLLIELSPIYLDNKQGEIISKIQSHGYDIIELTDYNYFATP